MVWIGWCSKEYIRAWSAGELDIRAWVDGDQGAAEIDWWKEEERW